MAFHFFKTDTSKQKVLTWASGGLLAFLFTFLFAPSRDALQIVYLLAFFIPILIVLVASKPSFKQYGGWPTALALIYAGFSTLSALWGNPKDFGFFLLQWLVLATWLCGSCLVFSEYKIDVTKYLHWITVAGAITIVLTFAYNFLYTSPYIPMESRLVGWNVFRNSNEIGAFCGIIALLAFTIALQSQSLRRTYGFYLLAFITGIGLVASISRGALLAFIIMAMVVFVIVRPKLRVWLPLAVLASLAILVLVNKTNIYIFYTSGRIEGFGFRFSIWKEILEQSKQNILFGIGMAQNTNIHINSVTFNHAHNAWLDTFYRVGLIGLLLILAHLIKVLQNFSRSQSLLPLYMWLGYGCICNLVDGRCFFWEIGAKWFFYWIPIGLIVAIQTGEAVRSARLNKRLADDQCIMKSHPYQVQ